MSFKRHRCRRQRHHARPRLDQKARVGVGHRSDMALWMRALATRIDERTLDMHPERSRDVLAAGFERVREHLGRIGHDRRRQRSGPEATVRRDDAADRFRRRRGVEEIAASAVDLPINEARRNDAAAEIDDRRHRFLVDGDDCADLTALDDERAVVTPTVAVKQTRAHENLHQRVSVILRRFWG